MNRPISPFVHIFRAPTSTSPWTVLALHGTGGDEHDLLPLAEAVAPGLGVLSPRGRVSEHGANRFFRRIREGVFDLVDLRLQTDELADFVAESAQTYGFDPSRVVALGFSNGANVAANLLLHRPESLAAAILIRPMLPQSPAERHNLSAKRILILAGEHDSVTPYPLAEALGQELRQQGATVAFHLLPAGHGLTQADVVHGCGFMEHL